MAQLFLAFKLLIFLKLTVNTGQQLTCSAECQCRYYPRRPVTCTYSNGISAFPNNIPSATSSLSISGIYLQHNHIGRLQHSHFSNLGKLLHLSLPFSEISEIEDGTFSNLSNLLTLNLRNNELNRISPRTFEELKSTYSIELTPNVGCVIDDGAFSSLAPLRYLYLGQMALGRIPNNLDNLLKLTHLFLNDNMITHINESMLQHMQNLKLFDLSGNLIMTFSSSMREIMKKIQLFNIFGNPLHCNCESKWLATLPIQYLYHKEIGKTLLCATPEHVRFTSVVDMSNNDFMCMPPKIITCGGSQYHTAYGENVTISCVIEADPNPSVVLVNPKGQNIVSETVPYYSHLNRTVMVNLKIQSASKADYGLWTLKVSNKKGNASERIAISLAMPTTTYKFKNTSPTSTFRLRNSSPFWLRNTSPLTTFGIRNTSRLTTSHPRNASRTTTVRFRSNSPMTTFRFMNTSQSTTYWFGNKNPITTTGVNKISKSTSSNVYIVRISIGVGIAYIVCSVVLAYIVHKKYKNYKNSINP